MDGSIGIPCTSGQNGPTDSRVDKGSTRRHNFGETKRRCRSRLGSRRFQRYPTNNSEQLSENQRCKRSSVRERVDCDRKRGPSSSTTLGEIKRTLDSSFRLIGFGCFCRRSWCSVNLSRVRCVTDLRRIKAHMQAELHIHAR